MDGKSKSNARSAGIFGMLKKTMMEREDIRHIVSLQTVKEKIGYVYHFKVQSIMSDVLLRQRSLILWSAKKKLIHI